MNPFERYNPLDKRHLGASVAEALLETEAFPIQQLPPFEGAGIYAIYFTGDEPDWYEPIAARNRDSAFGWPIYVGKAVPAGARKGRVGLDMPAGRVLYNRLREHAESIDTASNLDVGDFWCRVLVVDDIWIPLGEALLIARFGPIWNTLVDGFGNHDPGKGRYQGWRPRWDVLHPGRAWAFKCADRLETFEQIASEVGSHLRQTPVPSRPRLLLS